MHLTACPQVGAGIQLTPNVTRLLSRWGVSPLLEKDAVEPKAIYMRRWSDGKAIGRTKLVPEFRANFDAPYWVVHRAHLHQALYDRAVALGANVVVNARVVGIDFESATVSTVSFATVICIPFRILIQPFVTGPGGSIHG